MEVVSAHQSVALNCKHPEKIANVVEHLLIGPSCYATNLVATIFWWPLLTVGLHTQKSPINLLILEFIGDNLEILFGVKVLVVTKDNSHTIGVAIFSSRSLQVKSLCLWRLNRFYILIDLFSLLPGEVNCLPLWISLLFKSSDTLFDWFSSVISDYCQRNDAELYWPGEVGWSEQPFIPLSFHYMLYDDTVGIEHFLPAVEDKRVILLLIDIWMLHSLHHHLRYPCIKAP